MYTDTGGPTTGSTPVTRFSSRLLPLWCINLAVQDFSEERLWLCFHTGHRIYLQLSPGPGSEGLFLCWALLAHMLHMPRALSLLNTRSEGAMPIEEASSTSEVEEEDMTTGIVLPMDKASPSAEIDKTSSAASTPEVIPEQTCAEHLSSNQDGDQRHRTDKVGQPLEG
ncbi:protein FAM71A-like [Cygnus olor]|uniref:protein FAM71A-like n=1 Tax=Cygnus olor TaxID=8869 RepID=UPI001ADE9E7C|nr:protein FAM71A-like [Cygnus olor]